MGKDKGLVNFRGKKLVEYSIELLEPMCDEILISSNQSAYEDFGFPVVSDNYSACGPIGGLEAGLRKSKNEMNIVLSCDTPFLVPELLLSLTEKAVGYDCVVPVYENGIEPLVAIYNKKMSTFFERKIKEGNYKLRQVIKELNTYYYSVSHFLKKYPELFNNLNSPNDLDMERGKSE